MHTDELIAHLSDNLAPAPRGMVPRVLLTALIAGSIATILLFFGILRPRPDLHIVIGTTMFWSKFGYTAALALIGFVILQRQARAGANCKTPLTLLLVPVVAMALLSSLALSQPEADSAKLVMGASWMVCPWLIGLLALPLLAALLFGLRQLAPTRLMLSGAAAGLAAGAGAATLYGFHCPEMSAPFVLIWYTIGIGAVSLIGALIGPRILRW